MLNFFKKNGKVSKIYHDVFGNVILCGLGIISIQKINQLFFNNNELVKYLFYILIVIVASIYICLCWSDRKRDRKNVYNKIILLVRLIIFAIYVIFIFEILTKFIFNNQSYKNYFNVILLLYVFVEYIAIAIGIRWFKTLCLIGLLFPLLLLIGAFDIKWWALVSSLITLLIYLNSPDFMFLFKSKSIDDNQNYIWQRNKFLIYISTVFLYLTFIVSNFFENNEEIFKLFENKQVSPYEYIIEMFGIIFNHFFINMNNFMNRSIIRLYTFLLILILLVIIGVVIYLMKIPEKIKSYLVVQDDNGIEDNRKCRKYKYKVRNHKKYKRKIISHSILNNKGGGRLKK